MLPACASSTAQSVGCALDAQSHNQHTLFDYVKCFAVYIRIVTIIEHRYICWCDFNNDGIYLHAYTENNATESVRSLVHLQHLVYVWHGVIPTPHRDQLVLLIAVAVYLHFAVD